MHEIKLKLDERKRGAFYIEENDEILGEMVIGISGTSLTVYHTEVNPEMEGKGLAREMFDAMVSHARTNGLGVVPLCQYVLTQFRRHPDDYKDVWRQ